LGVLVLVVLLRRTSTARLLVASAIAGLALGTKASGSYYAVLIAATFIADRLLKRPTDWRVEARAWLRIGVPATGVFVAVWLLSNPYILSNWSNFLNDFMREQAHVSRGHGMEVDTSMLDWMVKIVKSFSVWGFIPLLFGWLGVVGLARSAYRDHVDSSALPPAALVIGSIAFVAVTTGHLMLFVDNPASRYLLPILPAMVWLSAFGWSLFIARWPRFSPGAVALLLAVPVAANAWHGVESTKEFADRNDHPRIHAGLWLADHYPRSTRILLERYSYAPMARFDDIQIVTRITSKTIAQHPSDVIVINHKKSGRWSWRRDGTRFEDRDFVVSEMDKSAEMASFHMELFAPESPWKVIFESDDVVILEQKGTSKALSARRIDDHE
jgi:hypothetical protein